MSDFLVSMDKRYSGKDLLNLVKKPYGRRAPEGKCFDFSWGAIAILNERFADNIFTKGGTVFAWVGDLLTNISDGFLDALIESTTKLRSSKRNTKDCLKSNAVFGKLNGAFAILLADEQGLSIITDFFNFIQVYKGANSRNKLICVGTHPDLVAGISDRGLNIDMVSVGQFLSAGTPTFPNTIHKNVKELGPGRLYKVNLEANKVEIEDFVYWSAPEEMRQGYDEKELSEELASILVSVVRDRCNDKKVGVFLSGGLDSRSILAAVPETVDCMALTFSNYPNRETKIARRVAQCYRRDWTLLIRDKEFLGNCVVDAVKLTGCEYEWINAQSIGLVEDIAKHRVSSILSGTLFDDYFKAHCALDWSYQKRMAGLLPRIYKPKDYEYVGNMSGFGKENLKKEITEQIYCRRKSYCESNSDPGRGSMAEWLELYPFTQDCTIGYWPVERRVLPVRLPAMDRRVLDFAFKCPVELKLGKKIFLMAAKNIYGPGARIPDANDGVRPGSGHWWRLAQRTVCKAGNRATKVFEKLGKEPQVQHSWHDYQKYWRESNRLEELRERYGSNLDQFDGVLFNQSGLELLCRKDIDWHYGFRILQLSIWLDIIEEYKTFSERNGYR